MIVGDLIKDIIRANFDYLKEQEKNLTELAAKTAELELKVNALQGMREIAEKYFDQNLEERIMYFDSSNEVLQIAITTKNDRLAKCAIREIEVITRKNLFSF